MKKTAHIHDYCLFKPHKKLSTHTQLDGNIHEFFIIMGRQLKEKRESLSLSVHDVCQLLKIRETYIKSIENGDIEELPGSIYTKSFIKNYNIFLGFDAAEELHHIDLKLKEFENCTNIKLIKPEIPESKPSGKEICLSLLCVLFGYMFWLSISSNLTHENEASIEPTLYSLQSQMTKDFPRHTSLIDTKSQYLTEILAENH